VKKMMELVRAVNDDPDKASFTFHAVNEWIDGTRNQTLVHRLTGANEVVERERPFVIKSDEPSVLLGEDTAPNSVVSLLHSLASCLSVTIIFNAASRGMVIDKLSITMEGDLDLHGFLGLSKEVRPGFQDVRVTVELRSESPRHEIEALVRDSQKRSPILDSLRNRIPVEIELA